MELSKQLKDIANNYTSANDDDKTLFIDELYNKELLSIGEIAKLANTYPNRIRRDAIKLGLSLRDKSTAQKLALQQGRHQHPTEGRQRSEETKIKISESVSEAWSSLDEEELERRRQLGKEQWENMTPEERESLHRKAGDAIRRASRNGSKLERFVLQALLEKGYNVSFHAEQFVVNEKLQIDLLIPDLKVAIEIDGPSHFMPIWGEEAFQKSVRADREKNALLISQGYVVIRVQQTKSLSEKFKRDVIEKLVVVLEEIREEFPEKAADRHIVIGDN